MRSQRAYPSSSCELVGTGTADSATYSCAMDTLITTEELAEALGRPDLVVLDCTIYLHPAESGYRSESGLAKFEEAHIPGAAFADLDEALVDTSTALRYAVPTPEHFAGALEQLGVRDGTRVVLYDDNQTMWAARVWWMLRWIGFDNAALLDGGLKAWKAQGRPTQSGAPSPTPARAGSITISPRPSLIADRTEVAQIVESGAACLVDALPKAVYEGKVQPYHRPGHIPTAVNVPASSMVDRGTGLFRPVEEIEALLPDRKEARTVIY